MTAVPLSNGQFVRFSGGPRWIPGNKFESVETIDTKKGSLKTPLLGHKLNQQSSLKTFRYFD